MDTKNLPLKFAILCLLVLACLYPLLFGTGLRPGPDLAGGYSMIFEIITNSARIEQLDVRLAALTSQLDEAKKVQPATSASEKQIVVLNSQIDRLEIQKKGYQAQKSRGNIAQEVVSILKERVDPTGMRSTEWRVVGRNRFEVRMPAPSEKSRIAKQNYREAQEQLQSGNIQPSEIRRIQRASSDKREAEILTAAGTNKAMAEALGELADSWDSFQLARGKFEQSEADLKGLLAKPNVDAEQYKQFQSKVDQAQKVYDSADLAYRAKRDQLTKSEKSNLNVNLVEVEMVLSNFVSEADAKVMMDTKEIKARRESYNRGLERIRSRYQSRLGEIDAAVNAYEAWAKTRQRLDDPADLQRLIAKAGMLSFRIAPLKGDVGTNPEFSITAEQLQEMRRKLHTDGPDAFRRNKFAWFKLHPKTKRKGVLGRNFIREDYSGDAYVLLCNEEGFKMVKDPLKPRGPEDWQLTRPYVTFQQNEPVVGFEFNEKGAKIFAELTTQHEKKRMAILLDDEVYSAPVINEPITDGRGIIQMGKFDPDEVNDLVKTLKSGSLPASVNPNPVSMRSFGPALGKRNVERGVHAAIIGLVAVAAFMLVYYFKAGLIANVALFLNIILVLGVMSWMSASFTLPGIAGIILTLGIAVDANVLIFERLREEQSRGQSVRMALKNAYQRAFSAIFDANITTLITCLILAWVGSEEIRGFGITLGLGVVFSMFTSLVVTRWVFQLLLDTKLMTKPVFMLKLIGVPKINWLAKRHYFWVVSLVFVGLGVAALVSQGSDIFGIDFSAGTRATLTFKDDALLEGKLPNDGIVRDLFYAKAGELGFKRLADTAKVEQDIDDGRPKRFIGDYDKNGDGTISTAEWTNAGRNAEWFKFVDKNADGSLTKDELTKMPAGSYTVSTSETNLQLVKQVFREAFAGAVQYRTRKDLVLVSAAVGPDIKTLTPADAKIRKQRLAFVEEVKQELGLDVGINAWVQISDKMVSKASKAKPRNVEVLAELRDFEGAVLFIGRLTNSSMSIADVGQRIREMRLQPDYAEKLVSETRIFGLEPAQEGYKSFAIVMRPPLSGGIGQDAAIAEFAREQQSLLKEAFEREETIPSLNFDAAVAGEAASGAIFAVLLSWVAIVLYLWIRFGSVQWGLAAVICLIHDVLIVVGLVALSGWLYETAFGQALGIQSFKIDLAMVAAILTVIGYSVNDTIVVFDRIRENRGKLTSVNEEIINRSINQTLGRTLLTSGTTFIVVIVMYIWGGPGIHSFSFALLAGIIFGTYSSVAIASPLLLGFKKAIVSKTVKTTSA